MKKLDYTFVGLSGMNLIEASAGTGKTYAIASIYLRLLIEKKLTPDQILVVTYTEAATQELRSKIRNRITEALNISVEHLGEDPFLESLYRNNSCNGQKEVKEILERSLGAFDTASIFTIHGFCLKVLQDNAFESGLLYDTELVTDQSEFLQEIADDFWRMHFFTESAHLLGYALQYKASDVFKKLLIGINSSTGIEIIPDFSDEEIKTLEKDSRQAFSAVCRIWQDEQAFIKQLLLTDKALKRSENTYRIDRLEPLFDKIDAFVAGGNPYDLFKEFERFTVSGIESGKKIKGISPQHLFFESCELLHVAVEQRFLALQAELVRFYGRNLQLRKMAENVRFFDDLLDDLYKALASENGDKTLSGILREKYRAALIDEFQDTNSVQYEIFRKIYAGSDNPLFLVGDPKQAIYSFRGADIFAYMLAVREVSNDRQFTLTENWRSSPLLLQAFNTLFDNSRQPFVYDKIVYHPLSASIRKNDAFRSNNMNGAPLQLWLMDSRNKKNGVLTVDQASIIASVAVAGEIARLLHEGREGKAFIGDKPVVAGDIAVIVRTHRQATMILDALRTKGVAGVMRSDLSIFRSQEAGEVRILLSALCEPGNESKVRAALVTDILGRSGNDIALFNQDEASSVACLKQFRAYHDMWLERGFIVMSRDLMAKEKVRERLLGYPDSSGERRLTNLLHCFDLLHQKEHANGFGMEGLAAWFSEMCGTDECTDEYQIRLETDETAVKIVTVHISKGLEYPVVFCPFLWGGVNITGKVIMFHNENGRLVKDFGSPNFEHHQVIAAKESLAESLRLLYVAITRAQYRCYLITGKTRSDRSPIDYLLHVPNEKRKAFDPLALLAFESATLTAEEMACQLQAIAESSNGAIGFSTITRQTFECNSSVTPVTAKRGGFSLVEPIFRGKIETSWRVSSFTSLSCHEPTISELPDRDEREVPAVPLLPSSVAEKSIFTFPRGAQAGIFMHGIFEHLNFTSPTDLEISGHVEKGLERYGYDSDWEPYITGMVHNVLSTPLASKDGMFTLGSLRSGSWITEFEFFFPLKFVTPAILGKVFSRYGIMTAGTDLSILASMLQFRPAKGILMGFMDMVFEKGQRYYLIDWKSNHLGNSIDDYRYVSIKHVMEKNLYHLQYLLYTVALNRYLLLKVENYSYSKNFGGVLYFFLRGVNREQGAKSGIFRDYPSEELIEELTNILIEKGE
ncbi:MAG: exodeoxyribonuclease V subunit beta [Chlorobiaceae bacterium]